MPVSNFNRFPSFLVCLVFKLSLVMRKFMCALCPFIFVTNNVSTQEAITSFVWIFVPYTYFTTFVA